MIDQPAKEFFDDFEGVHDDFYSCKLIEVTEPASGTVHQVYTYVLDNFNEDLLNDKAVLFDNYTSVNQIHPEYEKRLDTPDNLTKVLSVVKKKQGN